MPTRNIVGRGVISSHVMCSNVSSISCGFMHGWKRGTQDEVRDVWGNDVLKKWVLKKIQVISLRRKTWPPKEEFMEGRKFARGSNKYHNEETNATKGGP